MYKNLKTLEFDKIISEIKEYAQTNRGKKLVEAISPTNESLRIEKSLDETEHALKIINRYKEPPFGGIRSIEEILNRARIQAVLRPGEFLDVVGLIEGTDNNVQFYKQVKEHEVTEIELDYYFNQLMMLPKLKEQIQKIITIDGKIYDNASFELSRIRTKIQINERKVTEKLNHILNTQKEHLTDSLVTMRNGRFVVPVKQSDKNSFPGTIVDYSSSGETVYMEPTSVQEINNKITVLKIQEQREIERILRQLTEEVAFNHDQLLVNYETLTELDVIFAKAKHAQKYNCLRPEISLDEVYLRHARHPLINQDEVVPNTISLDSKKRIVIITGPNTGGKTVALKTVGLLSLMVQSGILIPAAEESKTIIFENIFADIGDEQSIEQSLSTFSSHISKIISIIETLSDNSLILLDELGSGTDPKEGAALAISLLEFFRQKNVYLMATTHYPELKVYAYDKEEVQNASVEFDVDSLRPTYRLLMGTPGKSNALQISERLGLNQNIINFAKKHVATSSNKVEELISKLETQGKDLDKKINEYEDLIAKEKLLVNESLMLKKALMEEKQKYNQKIDLENSQILKETKQLALKLIKEIEELKNKSQIKEHELAELKYKTRNLVPSHEQSSSTIGHEYSIGDLVNVLPYQRTGELIKKQKNGKWVVKMGNLTSQFEEKQFEFIENGKKPILKSIKVKTKPKKAKPELDLRGLRYEEAKEELERYIDYCLSANQPFATIIHGFGTLTLRKLVREYLKENPYVESFRDGEGGEGGQGVTIVNFK
jgi:DNA mismatch repair protein MutS2